MTDAPRPRTVGELIRDTARRLAESGSETPRLDAELLLGHVLGVGRESLLAEPQAGVSDGQMAAFSGLVERRTTGEPVSYIRGLKEFYGLAFGVDPRALIPRPETELIVDIALDRLRTSLVERPRVAGTEPLSVWDVGVGSGAIVVSLAVEARRRGWREDVRFRATDASPEALSLATENAVAHGVADVIEFAVADLLAAPAARADLVTANLPYVPTADIRALPVAASFEPVTALDGGDDGLTLINRLIADLDSALTDGGVSLIEVGAGQGDRAGATAAERHPTWASVIHADLAGVPRVLELRKPGRS